MPKKWAWILTGASQSTAIVLMLTVLFITRLHREKPLRLKRLSKKAYFTQGRSIEKHESIRKIAAEIGLDSRQVDEILAGDHYAEDVRADERFAQELGITSVPFFLIEAQWVINGAQPPAAILEGLNRVWAETHKS